MNPQMWAWDCPHIVGRVRLLGGPARNTMYIYFLYKKRHGWTVCIFVIFVCPLVGYGKTKIKGERDRLEERKISEILLQNQPAKIGRPFKLRFWGNFSMLFLTKGASYTSVDCWNSSPFARMLRPVRSFIVNIVWIHLRMTKFCCDPRIVYSWCFW